jgi:antitoxin ParD1/3/4
MRTRNFVVTAEDASKLKALRSAARVGVAALDRGEFKEFRNIETWKHT